jgi:hypothetical protein
MGSTAYPAGNAGYKPDFLSVEVLNNAAAGGHLGAYRISNHPVS